MFARRVVMFALAAALLFFSPSAYAAIDSDGCDSTLFQEMTTRAQSSFDNMDSLVMSVNKPPSSIQNFKCARDNFSIWETGWKGISGIISGIISAILSWIMSLFGLSMLSLNIPGELPTLTNSSPFYPLIKFFSKNFFANANNTSEYVCPEIWTDSIGNAMRQISFGSSSYNSSLGIVQFGSSSFSSSGIVKFNLQSCLGGLGISFPTGMNLNGLVSTLQSQFTSMATSYINSLIGLNCFF